MVKLNKIEKNEELIAQYVVCSMSLEFVVSVVQRQKLTANSLNKLKQKVWYIRWANLETAI